MNVWDKIRADYPVCRHSIYLTTNGGGPVSTRYVKKAQQLLTELSEQGRTVMNEWDPQAENTRALVAQMLHATPQEIAFITNTSQGMSLIQGLFPKEYGVITMRDEFPSSFVPWLQRGHPVQFVDSDANGVIHPEDIEKQITPETKLLIVSHVMFRTGFRHDLKVLGDLCKKHDLIFVVDATQSFGVNPIDVADCNIDVLIFHAYKWVTAGYGIGAMYVSKRILQQYQPEFIGWYSVDYPHPDFQSNNDYSQFTPKQDATVFETGTLPYMNVLLLGHTLDYLHGIGADAIHEHVYSLITYLHQKAAENNVKILTSYAPQHLSPIQCLDITQEQYLRLEKHRIIARYKNDKLTLGINFYNNKEDIDAVFNALNAAE
ncbi:aminotransferase class V-fold PLP-dependent enzyme [Chitinophaga sp. Mgbs1]|uniref:Aminotransferase class V-fold PLP-dependent enzyme n=1 Tax=Chitinophaga solisilvae TaxID=1233460 RepID=A0A3S1B1N8_9BACT|nr:aminotransferase class V-fold PLP-dependent enzyme [Chitinophaga solisilvae]